MAGNGQPDRTKVTFSQAEGLEALPSPLALGELSKEVRSLIWRPIYLDLKKHTYHSRSGYGPRPYLTNPWSEILYDFHVLSTIRLMCRNPSLKQIFFSLPCNIEGAPIPNKRP